MHQSGSDDRDAQFQFVCHDGTLTVDVGRTQDLFPPISPVAILLSDRWCAGASGRRLELQCRPYSTKTIGLILDAMCPQEAIVGQVASEIWQCRHEFVAACDFLLLADTTAGQLATDLIAISSHIVVDICHDLSRDGLASNRSGTAQVTVSVAPLRSKFPFVRVRTYGIDVPRFANEWTRVVTRKAPVSSLKDLVDLACAEASQWSIMSPDDFSRAAAGERSSAEFCMLDDLDCNAVSDIPRRRRCGGDSGGVVVFRYKSACSDEVVIGLDDVHLMDPADAIVRSDRRDPVCALPAWAPPSRRYQCTAILVVGGTREGRMLTASAMARAMGRPNVVIHTCGSVDVDLACFGDASVSDDPPAKPDRNTVIVVPEIYRGDERQSLALRNVHSRRCSAIITSNSPTGKGIQLYSYDDVCVLVNPCTYRWALCLISLGFEGGDAILQSCERRAADSGAIVCAVRVRRNGMAVYSPDDPTAVGPCDRCAITNARPCAVTSE